MLSFSINSEIRNKALFLIDEKIDLTFLKIGDEYQFLNRKDDKVLISLSVSNSEFSIKSSFIETIKPFVYSLVYEKTKESLLTISISNNEKIKNIYLNEKELKISTDSSHIEFSLQQKVLILSSNKYLSLSPDQCTLQMMNF